MSSRKKPGAWVVLFVERVNLCSILYDFHEKFVTLQC